MRSVKDEVKDIRANTNSILRHVNEDMNIVSRTGAVKNLLQRHREDKSENLIEESELEFASLFDKNGMYFRVELLDGKFRKVASVIFDKDSALIQPSSSLKKTPIHFYRNAVSNFEIDGIQLLPSEMRSPKTGAIIPSIECILPLNDATGNETGVLIASVHAEVFFKIFALPNKDKSIKVVLVNGEGFYLFHSQKKKDWNRLLAARQEENLYKDYPKAVADSILDGMEGTITDDPDRIIEFASIFSKSDSKTNKYIVFTEIPTEIAFAYVDRLKYILILVCLFVALLSVIIGYFTAEHFIRPIHKLINGTRIIREGNLDYKLEIRGKDELQDLVLSINQLVSHWKVMRELEEKQRREKDIKERKEYLETIMDSSLDLLITMTADGMLSYANKRLEYALGYNPQDIQGKYLLDFIAPELRDYVNEKWLESNRNGGVIFETKLLKSDGSFLECLISHSKLKGLNEFLAIVKDITELKLAERTIILAKEKAEEASRLKTNFLANMSHELRTPMIGILGFSKILVKTEDVSESKEIGELILESSSRLMDTLNLIIDFSRIESGDLQIHVSDVDLIEVIAMNMDKYFMAARDKNLDFIFDCELDSFYINNDRNIIDIIIRNLVDNAIKFTYKGEVRITLNKISGETGDYAVIKISDTGIGIPEDSFQVIFDEFRQISEGLRRSYDGTGLGLALVKKYLGIIGGKIELQSAVNVGSTFTVLLPVT